ncbi:DUF4148 domain-containing protein [Ramlibacter tataouinensis]|uniref:DUF4148 domain-containing protein n=1 Tax=Ramlibacter tataouinensis (strain ATCC BAA-407 / DSM 14655 / LMG 21543 / TTB310) TaxID=365046 RepID=F5Y2U0_RAMTT|nr:DUF4148 domain-containing protein [Ramlibacter tataouinensis]AEG93636.1 Hypothetical protein Rta_25400 [Ramlibacter tataouinensis TTB310]
MNAKIAASLVLAAAAGGAWAETPTVVTEPFFPSRTRAEVQAELGTYRQAGVNPWSTSYNQLRGFQRSASREEVVADYLRSRDEVAARTGEDSGSAWLAQHRSQPELGGTFAGQPSEAGRQ